MIHAFGESSPQICFDGEIRSFRTQNKTAKLASNFAERIKIGFATDFEWG